MGEVCEVRLGPDRIRAPPLLIPYDRPSAQKQFLYRKYPFAVIRGIWEHWPEPCNIRPATEEEIAAATAKKYARTMKGRVAAIKGRWEDFWEAIGEYMVSWRFGQRDIRERGLAVRTSNQRKRGGNGDILNKWRFAPV